MRFFVCPKMYEDARRPVSTKSVIGAIRSLRMGSR
jgi:hypothetical protein